MIRISKKSTTKRIGQHGTREQWESMREGIKQNYFPIKNLGKPYAVHYGQNNHKMFFYVSDDAKIFLNELIGIDRNQTLRNVLNMGDGWAIQGTGNGVYYTSDFGKININK